MHNSLKLVNQSTTLVDNVEEKLRDFFKERNLIPGDNIPTEAELAEALGVARSVLREALSRFRMLGLIETRTKRGMILREPDILGGIERVIDPRIISKERLLDILGLRVTIEIGMGDYIFLNKTEKDIQELEDIVNRETVLEINRVTVEEESKFHYKLYEMTGNPTISRLCKIFSPVFIFIKENYDNILREYKIRTKKEKWPAHKDLVNIIKNGNAIQFREAMKKHLEIYFHLLSKENMK
ncbi:MAG: FadR family transcriptional regulator [Bacteroidales bacterium]|nr:FadR family transcriptional regulator [Bacteroidales bacterium]